MVRTASFLPSTIFDLTAEGQKTLLGRRIAGQNPVHWYGQTPRAIRSIPQPVFTPFTVIMLGKEENPSDYDAWMSQSPVLPTIVAHNGGHLSFAELSPMSLQSRFLKICETIPNDVDMASISTAKEMISSWQPVEDREIGYQVGGQNSVIPNLTVLASAGYANLTYGPFKDINRGIQPYVDQLVRTSESIFLERFNDGERDMQRIFRPTIDLILFAPSIYPHFLQMPLPPKMDRNDQRRFRLVRQALDRQVGYSLEIPNDSAMEAMLGIDAKDSHAAKTESAPHPLLFIRKQELDLATEAVGSLAVSEFSAVLRLPNDVNRTAGIVRTFAEQYRARNISPRKRLLAFRQVQARLRDAFPSEFINLIRKSKSGIRIIADAHLEWLDIDGLPLCIRKNVVRMPVTPGNLFIDQASAADRIMLTPHEMSYILVISALKHDDPISQMFELAFDGFGKEWKDLLKIEYVDVANEDEFVAAINNFSGQLVIFDGHGGHQDDLPAALYLQDHPVDVWTLKDRIIRMPPIVVLSACDTHAADRNHATVANGFLALGARTVLASVFPLFAPAAAVLVARLLYRIAAFLKPAIKLSDQAITWVEVVSGLLRMQLLTDFLHELLDNNLIDKETYIDIGTRGNIAINSDSLDPFALIIQMLVERGLGQLKLEKILESVVANSSVISYLQVGRPETISIDDKDRVKRQLRRYEDSTTEIPMIAPGPARHFAKRTRERRR